MTPIACPSCEASLAVDDAACPRCGAAVSPPGDSGATPNAQRLQRALGSQFEVVRLVGRGGFAEATPSERRASSV